MDAETDMTLDAFETLVALYGANPSTWPAETQAAAAVWCARPEGQAILADYARLEAGLATALAPPKALPHSLTARLLEVPNVHLQSAGFAARARALFKDLFDLPSLASPQALGLQAAALSLVFMVGLWAGLEDPESKLEDVETIDLADAWMGGDGYGDDWTEGSDT